VPYRVEYDPDAAGDLDYYRGRVAGVQRVEDAAREQLRHEPMKKTRNRFAAAPGAPGEWELRVQPFRVYYDVDEDEQVVAIRAVLYKPREKPYRRGRETSTRE
jgi:mRNA-degrading endonuclease RelE of RelBE toxin-antitoxin system